MLIGSLLSAWLLVDRKLPVVKVWGSQSYIHRFPSAQREEGTSLSLTPALFKGPLYFISFIFMERYNLPDMVFYILSQATVTGETHPTPRKTDSGHVKTPSRYFASYEVKWGLQALFFLGIATSLAEFANLFPCCSQEQSHTEETAKCGRECRLQTRRSVLAGN